MSYNVFIIMLSNGLTSLTIRVIYVVITILEAQVDAENWGALEQAYKEGAEPLPTSIPQSFLVQSSTEPTV